MHFCNIFTSVAVPTIKEKQRITKKDCSFMAYYIHIMQLNRLQGHSIHCVISLTANCAICLCCCLIYPACKSHLHGTTYVLIIIKYFIGLAVSATFLVIIL